MPGCLCLLLLSGTRLVGASLTQLCKFDLHVLEAFKKHAFPLGRQIISFAIILRRTRPNNPEFKMKLFLIICVLLGLNFSSSNAFVRPRSGSTSKSRTIPPTAVTGDVTANFESECSLDGPQLSAVNGTSWDWWYFDAVSSDGKSNVVIVFYTASSSGFAFLPPSPDITLFQLHSLLPNGTVFDVFIPAEEAVITTVGEGSSGDFKGTNASWTGSSDLKHYKIKVDSPANGVVGTFNLRSLAPGHYPCGPIRSGENMMVAPEIGWANAVPDGDADVDFTIAGVKVAFKGVGYHDKVNHFI